MRHIVIPTDFTISSLQPIHTIMEKYASEPVRISLLHLLYMPTGIMDLLTRPSDAMKPGTIDASFTNACQVLKNKYGTRIADLDIVVRYGSTTSFLCNLLEAMKAEALFVAEPFSFTTPCKQSVNMSKLLKSRRYKINRIPISSTAPQSLGNSLSELLVSESFEKLEPSFK